MNANQKTMLFIVAAMASIGIAAGVHFANSPASLEGFSDVGSPFYEEFADPNQATGLRVASYNKETGKTDVFNVEFKDGLWRIPSHHNYPADGQDRLAKVAASMIGVNRQALVEKTPAAQKRYNLLDPLDSKNTDTEGRGDRITLTRGDQPLVDFIVGKKVDGKQDEYYVRRADEDRFYTADLGNFSISTKFSDWIKKDVLEINRSAVTELVINRYYVDEAKGRVVPEGTIKLTRTSGSAPWEMEGLNLAEETVKTAEVNNMLNALDDMQIVGVRPKPAVFSKGLKGEGELAIDPLTEMQLQEKGFFVGPRGEMVSNEGEVNIGLNDGVLYVLGFGEEFSGTEVDIEAGSSQKETAADANAEKKSDGEKGAGETKEEKPAGADADSSKDKDDSKPEDKPSEPDLKKSRYLMVTAHFDKSLLGPAPVEPVKPEQPAEQPEAEKKPAEASPEAKPAESAPTTGTTEEAKPDAAAENQPAADPKADYEAALKTYEEELEAYKIQQKDYEEKLKQGQERVTELNRRFADWFYVISEDAFARLKLKREDLVEKVPPPSESATSGTAPLGPAGLGIPGLEFPAMNAEPPAAPTSGGEQSPPSTPEPSGAPAADKPADESAPAETSGKSQE